MAICPGRTVGQDNWDDVFCFVRYRLCRSDRHWKSRVQVRSGMWAYAGAARRRIHNATVFPRRPSGHHPRRRQARHARILQIESSHSLVSQIDQKRVIRWNHYSVVRFIMDKRIIRL